MDVLLALNSTIMWFILFILFIVVELATAGALVSIWFCLGSLAALSASRVGANFLIQFVVFLVVSIAFLILTKPFVNKVLKQKKEATNYDMVIGLTGVVVEKIDNIAEKGAVKVHGKIWTARAAKSEEIIPLDSQVKILEIQGVKLLVEKI